ncbi:MAG: thioredoxin [Candidatus Chisholmbacteria bacterium RIFCSPHIGHO2_01_FULL_48_12]|uniref:Thioredoxin n=1 Tax=Candidatus Chisholmbacteria bacterium RIFCSPHIGHO2_01_FULL_48_12 TaxID=1797589 RepID=A0A1G1VRN4_9BACT|nr:MAG: thioredoxin [Candidatus Chisholmbacteria bacterium RIFCSPHIGHO2_01_FULL_48_12]
MATVVVTDENFDEVVSKSQLPIVVDFWASWCGPCIAAEPIIEELAGAYAGKVVMGKLNVDENQAKAAEFGVMSIPTVIGFKNGQEVERKIGFGGKANYEDLIKRVSQVK